MKTPKNKIILVTAVVITSIILVSQLWRQPLILLASLLIVTIIKTKISPIQKNLLMFIVFGLLGSFGESLIMFGGPWSYTQAQLINFPVWLPFLWGLAGITGITLYEALSKL